MGKAKKRKTEDFHKPKLKVGKRKPVGTNVTKTEFKTSTINIASQLEEINDPKTKKNQTLKDLLSQINHYNATIRHEACLGFRDLFQNHPDIMHNQIGTWISKLFGKVVDIDSAVRHSLHLTIQYVMKNLTISEVSPFVNIIVAHICCGLTHINEAVQIDALLLVDIILEKFPKLFVSYGGKLLPSLVDLVSKQGKRETNSSQTLNTSKVHKGIPSLVSRDVSFNVEGKMSSLKARMKILDKVHRILTVLFDDLICENESNEQNYGRCSDVFIPEDKQIFERIYPSCSDRTLRSLQDWISYTENRSSNKEHEYATEFLHSIYPVLLNSWIEFEPGHLSSGLHDSSSVRSSIPGMSNIISILDIFIKLEQKNNTGLQFLKGNNQFKDFCQHFLNYFNLPFSFTSNKIKSIAKQETANQFQRFTINFNFVMAKALCEIFSQEKCLFDGKQRRKYLKRLNNFCMAVLENSGLLIKENIHDFINIFTRILNLKYKLSNKEGIHIEHIQILQEMTQCYARGSITSPWKIPLLKFFKSLCFEKNSRSFDESTLQEVRSLIKIVISNVWSLPGSSILLMSASLDFIQSVVTYKLCTGELEKSLEMSIISMTDPHKGLHQSLDEDNFQRMVQLIYSIPKLPRSVIKNAAILCISPNVSIRNRKYLMSIIGLSLQKPQPSLELEDFINFILTILANYDTAELNRLNSENERAIRSWSILNLYNDCSKDLLVDHAVNQLQLLNSYHQLWDKLMSPVGKFLVSFRQLPVSTAFGIIKLLSKLSEWSKERRNNESIETVTVNPAINQIADLLSAILLYTVSERFKWFHCKEERDNALEDDLICCAICLLSNEPSLLKQLVKKWINVAKEYDMDSSCVVSIAQVIMALLQEASLNSYLREMKTELLSISEMLSSFEDKSVLEHFNFTLEEYCS